MWTYVLIFTLVSALLVLWIRNYLRNHCLECKKRTDWDKYASCEVCSAEHKARIERHRSDGLKRMIAATKEVLEKSHVDQEEFGFSDYDLLDKPCTVCVTGPPKSHREIFRERGLSGNPQACSDHLWNTHFPLSIKAHNERESRKFWKRWLYIPPTAREEAAVGRISWMLQNTLLAGSEDQARPEYRTYHEKPDHWMYMSTTRLLGRRLTRIKSALGIKEN